MITNHSSGVYNHLSDPEFFISRSISWATDEITRIRTDRNRILDFLIIITGWIYFFLWIIASYPQFITNYRAKSVAGFSLNYQCLTILGHLSYSIYNILFYFVPIFDAAYHEEHPNTSLPVYLNDVSYSVHNLIINSLIGVQCIVYERGDQTIWHNYRRKSTEGWNIVGVLLDISGSTLSAIQMGLAAFKDESWHPINGNLGKLGLSLISLAFCVVFIIQHFCLYHNHGPAKEPSVYFSRIDQIREPKQKSVEEKVRIEAF